MNIFTFSGNLGQDCEVRTAGSSTVCQFSVAVKAGYGDKESTIWTRCALWGKRAEGNLPEYLKKGQQVVVSGELSLNVWTTKEGTQMTDVEVNVDKLTLVGKREEPANHPQPTNGYDTDKFQGTGEDVPF